MQANEAIILARKHVGNGATMESSARAALADAVRCYDAGDLHSAKEWALKSLMYSVGLFHRDCKRVADGCHGND